MADFGVDAELMVEEEMKNLHQVCANQEEQEQIDYLMSIQEGPLQLANMVDDKDKDDKENKYSSKPDVPVEKKPLKKLMKLKDKPKSKEKEQKKEQKKEKEKKKEQKKEKKIEIEDDSPQPKEKPKKRKTKRKNQFVDDEAGDDGAEDVDDKPDRKRQKTIKEKKANAKRQARYRAKKAFLGIPKTTTYESWHKGGTEAVQFLHRMFKTFSTYPNLYDFWKVYWKDEIFKSEPSTSAESTQWETAKSDLAREFKDLVPLTDEEIPTVATAVKTFVQADDTLELDPVICARTYHNLWNRFVPQDERDRVLFRSDAGDGWFYSSETALWELVSVRQMETAVWDLTEAHWGPENVVFTTEKQSAYFRKQTGCPGALKPMIQIIAGKLRYPQKAEEKLDREPWLIPLLDGRVFNARTCLTRHMRKSDYFVNCTRFNYVDTETNSAHQIINDRKAREELLRNWGNKKRMMELLEQMFPNVMEWINLIFPDPARRHFVLVRLGAMLSGHNVREVTFLVGNGKAGKSTFFHTILEMLGRIAMVIDKGAVVARKEEGKPRPDIIATKGCRFVLIDEMCSEDRLDTTLMKNWAAKQKVNFRNLYEKNYREGFFLDSQVIVLTNDAPQFENSTGDIALKQRIQVIRTNTRFFTADMPECERPRSYVPGAEWKEQEEDGFYWVESTPEREHQCGLFKTDQERKDELGTFICVLTHIVYEMTNKGCTQSLPVPSESTADKKDFFRSQDVIGNFLDDYYEEKKTVGPGVRFPDVWAEFQRVMYTEYGCRNMQKSTFTKKIQERGLFDDPRNQGNAARTLKLVKRSQPGPEARGGPVDISSMKFCRDPVDVKMVKACPKCKAILTPLMMYDVCMTCRLKWQGQTISISATNSSSSSAPRTHRAHSTPAVRPPKPVEVVPASDGKDPKDPKDPAEVGVWQS